MREPGTGEYPFQTQPRSQGLSNLLAPLDRERRGGREDERPPERDWFNLSEKICVSLVEESFLVLLISKAKISSASLSSNFNSRKLERNREESPSGLIRNKLVNMMSSE